jgi:nucleoid-associated protein YgaU
MTRTVNLRALPVLAGAVCLVLAAHAGGWAQNYDISEGTYLTEEQYKKLSGDEAMEYCDKLAQEIDIQNDNAAAANAMMSDIDSAIRDLQRQLADARAATSPLASEVAELERKLREMQQLPRSYTVVKDDFLIKISEMRKIYGDGSHWKRIYRANRDKINDPNLIYPDQIFLIPRGKPNTHVVYEGETLIRIAGYVEVYGDRSQWPRIYEANKDRISDPNIIEPGMTLNIPR